MITSIVASEKTVCCEINAGMRMRADQYGGIPIPAESRFTLTRLRLDIQHLPILAIETDKTAVLRFGINDVRVFGIDLREKSITDRCYEPIGIANSADIHGSGWTAEAQIVLRSAIDVINRKAVIDSHAVKLRYG